MHSHPSQQLPLKRLRFAYLLAVFSGLLWSAAVQALPVFERQTGQNCVACHAGGQFPELTPYGRIFKLTGYTIGTRTVPLSVMGVASYTKSRSPDPADPAFAKDAVALFQTASVFLAGNITNNLGLFAQVTYNNYDNQDPDTGKWHGKTGSDNLDLRYADRFIDASRDLIVGMSLNNNPSLADPWNTAPAWIQYVPTGFGVTGIDAAPMVAQLGQQAAGVGVYAFWNNTIYAEMAGYRTANGILSFTSQGTPDADQTKLKGVNPYLRLALNHDWGPHSAMVGLMAMDSRVYPDNLNPTGPTTKFRDRGIDAQYQCILDPHTITVQVSHIRESIDGGDVTGYATNATNTLTRQKVKASYIYRAKYGGSLSYFSTKGSADATLYGSNASLTPDTRGWIPEVFWTPLQYMRIGAQYFAYDRFNGSKANYDGGGRNAKDNNTFFVYLWGAY